MKAWSIFFAACFLFICISNGPAQPKPDFVVTVMGPDGPLERATVTVTAPDGPNPPQLSSQTNEEGKAYFTLTNGKREFLGKYKILISKPGYKDEEAEYEAFEGHATPAHQSYYVKKMPDLIVTILSAPGDNPVQNATVTVTAASGPNPPKLTSLTNQEGRAFFSFASSGHKFQGKYKI